MPKLNVQQTNQNVIQAFKNALAIGNLKGIIASDGSHNFSTAGSNRNLLDNPWFTVNQRAAATVSSVGYHLDRWYSYNNYTVTANGITTTSAGNFDQTLESALKTALNGQTVTMSAKLADGTVYSATGTYYSAYGSTYSIGSGGGITFYITGDGKARYTFGNNLSIRAVKLELGSVSTLANDTPPNYAEELRKCKYYYREVSVTTAYSVAIGYAYSNTGSVFTNIFGFCGEMRTSPTITHSGAISIRTTSGDNVTVTGIAANGGANGVFSIDALVASGLVANSVCRLIMGAGAKITFSADLQ